MKIKYKEWAFQLLKEIELAPAAQKVSILESHLMKASHRGRVAEIEAKWKREEEYDQI